MVGERDFGVIMNSGGCDDKEEEISKGDTGDESEWLISEFISIGSFIFEDAESLFGSFLTFAP